MSETGAIPASAEDDDRGGNVTSPKTGTLTAPKRVQNYGNASFYWYYGSNHRTKDQWEGGVSSEED